MSETITKSGYLTPFCQAVQRCLSIQTVDIDSAAVYPSCLICRSFFPSFILDFETNTWG